ncbi:MAG TPA: winged helix-turn-helix domain-containing protein [Anaerolineales bacterium]|nr:winged helix-turn-helix domain-containing protein [Anaerolineales bacterium]
MTIWDSYPLDYRTYEIRATLAAVQAGECVSLVGLSGSGKSNLVGFLAHRYSDISPSRPPGNWPPLFCLLDCNRLVEPSPAALLRFIRTALEPGASSEHPQDEFSALDSALANKLRDHPGICLLFDRFDRLSAETDDPEKTAIFDTLRALRDRHKYSLTYVTATRRPLDPHTELAELFFAHTIWLGPLQESDSRWSIQQYTQRQGVFWDEAEILKIIHLSAGYPALLRAICEAFADGATLDSSRLKEHPAISRRVAEFWADQPDNQALQRSRLDQVELLRLGPKPFTVDTTQLTAKENLLWQYLRSHPGEVCTKDDLILAVWPEDRIYEAGIRDDSLAQLVRRLREKIETDPSNPRHIQTIPGRGYCCLPG